MQEHFFPSKVALFQDMATSKVSVHAVRTMTFRTGGTLIVIVQNLDIHIKHK